MDSPRIRYGLCDNKSVWDLQLRAQTPTGMEGSSDRRTRPQSIQTVTISRDRDQTLWTRRIQSLRRTGNANLGRTAIHRTSSSRYCGWHSARSGCSAYCGCRQQHDRHTINACSVNADAVDVIQRSVTCRHRTGRRRRDTGLWNRNAYVRRTSRCHHQQQPDIVGSTTSHIHGQRHLGTTCSTVVPNHYLLLPGQVKLLPHHGGTNGGWHYQWHQKADSKPYSAA